MEGSVRVIQQEKTNSETIWVRGHAGWQGQQRATTGLVLFAAVFSLFALLFSMILFAAPAPALKLVGVGVLAAVAVGLWLLVAHIRVPRTRIVRVSVAGPEVVFAGVGAIIWPLRAFAPVGAILLASGVWSVFTSSPDTVTMRTLLGILLIGLIMLIAGTWFWFRAPAAHRLILRPEGLDLRIPRNNATLKWEDVTGASLERNRVFLRTASVRPSSWAVTDLASDPVLLAELVTYYANRPDARSEIGAGTLARLRSGDF
ncbi:MULTISPECIES: hypothetical protein [Microbacterium]|uniref:hypothetical protein n=1 Tax=Microbacterium TaxID=33882 RepID=UPI0028EAEA7A|nr:MULTISPECIES: hypothetical protein [Microbacterium]